MQRTRGYTPWLGRPLVAIVLMAATLLVSCSGDDTVAPDTIAPMPSTTIANTTSAEGTATTVMTTFPDDPPVQLSADGPWQRVASAPGITKPGLTYLLMPGVWVYLPTEENLDLGITWVLNEADLPIIEAYLMARLTYFAAITSDPIDLDLPGWKEWYTDGGAQYTEDLSNLRNEGRYAVTGEGIVLRPEVMGEDRSEATAIVSDCWLDGGYFLTPDGDLAPGSTRDVTKAPSAARLVMREHWMAEQIGRQPDVCDAHD